MYLLIVFTQAWKGDTEGNLVFHAAARNFNPEVSKASKVCVFSFFHSSIFITHTYSIS